MTRDGSVILSKPRWCCVVFNRRINRCAACWPSKALSRSMTVNGGVSISDTSELSAPTNDSCPGISIRIDCRALIAPSTIKFPAAMSALGGEGVDITAIVASNPCCERCEPQNTRPSGILLNP